MNAQGSAVVAAVLTAWTDGKTEEFRLRLHPYLHWTERDGTTVRGRVQVLSMLQDRLGPLEPPVSVELRDGQIYRWQCG